MAGGAELEQLAHELQTATSGSDVGAAAALGAHREAKQLGINRLLIEPEKRRSRGFPGARWRGPRVGVTPPYRIVTRPASRAETLPSDGEPRAAGCPP